MTIEVADIRGFSREIIIKFNSNYKIEGISLNCINVLGYTVEELIGKDLRYIIPDEKIYDLLDANRNIDKLELALVNKNNKPLYVDIKCKVENLNGKSLFYLSMIDITRYKLVDEKRERLKSLVENSKDILYRYEVNPEVKFSYLSPSIGKILGHDVQIDYNDPFYAFEIAHPDDRTILEKTMRGEIDYDKPTYVRWKNSKGNYIWFENHNVPIYNEKNELIAIEGISRDVEYRKQLEGKLKYLAYHDELTGVHNRRYFDFNFKKLDTSKDKAVALIACDVDDLKITNDNYGHFRGDELLKIAAKLLKKSLGKDAIICRLGGDEFVVILSDIDYDAAKEKLKGLKETIRNYNTNKSNKLAISIGFSFSETSNNKMSLLLKTADDKMYSNKRRRKLIKEKRLKDTYDKLKL